MLIVHVYIRVKPEAVEAFKEVTLANARGSVQEPGVIRFDVIQQADDPDRFILYEVWRDEAGMNAHKETPHYARWRDAVAPWMAGPRKGVKHVGHFPDTPEAWSARKG